MFLWLAPLFCGGDIAGIAGGGDWKRAEQAADRCLESSPSDPAATRWKAYFRFRAADYIEAARLARIFTKAEPRHADGHKLLGMSLFLSGGKAEARQELQLAAELAPQDGDAVYYLGRVYFETHDLPAAFKCFERAVAIDGRSVRARNHLGQTLEGLGRFDEARASYRAAIEMESKQAVRSEWPYYNLGLLTAREGNAAEAARLFLQAIERNPKSVEARTQLGAALAAAGRLEEAEKELSAALTLDANNAAAHYQMGRLLMKLRQPERAAHHLDAFARLQRK